MIERAMGFVKEEIITDDEILDEVRSDLDDILNSMRPTSPSEREDEGTETHGGSTRQGTESDSEEKREHTPS